MKINENKQFYTPTEVAELLPISKISVYKALQKGEIHSIRLGKKFLIPADSFNRIFGIEK